MKLHWEKLRISLFEQWKLNIQLIMEKYHHVEDKIDTYALLLLFYFACFRIYYLLNGNALNNFEKEIQMYNSD